MVEIRGMANNLPQDSSIKSSYIAINVAQLCRSAQASAIYRIRLTPAVLLFDAGFIFFCNHSEGVLGAN